MISIMLITFVAIIINLTILHKAFHSNVNYRLVNTVSLVKVVVLKNINQDKNKVTLFTQTLNSVLDLELELLAKNQKIKLMPEDKTANLILNKIGVAQTHIYDQYGHLIFRTVNSPDKSFFNNPEGLSNYKFDKMAGASFKYTDPDTHYTVIAFQNYDINTALEDKLTESFIITMLLIFPCLAIFIWIIVNKGLSSIKQVTNEVKKRLPNNLVPVDLKKVPKEIKALTVELNNLFDKLHETFMREKRFTSDAAHELKTPLAALKIQAQVALNSNDQQELTTALNNIIKSVDRSTHVINQLLILSRTLPEANIKIEKVSLNKEAAQVISDLLPFVQQKDIDIELNVPSNQQIFIMGNYVTIGVLIRNLVDNAIRYSPNSGLVQVVIESDKEHAVLKVIDNGPGIPEELREKVFERFFRVLGTTQPGCGLGLNIVKQIALQHNAEVKLLTPSSGKGLEIDVIFKLAK